MAEFKFDMAECREAKAKKAVLRKMKCRNIETEMIKVIKDQV